MLIPTPPPPRCIACGHIAPIDDDGNPRCTACGAELPARHRPLAIPSHRADLPPWPPPPTPPICGTALLSIERIGKLRATAERTTTVVRTLGDGLEVRLRVPDPAPPDGLALPVTIGVLVLGKTVAFDGGTDASIELRPGVEATCRVSAKGLRAGSPIVLWLRFADALYERALVVES